MIPQLITRSRVTERDRRETKMWLATFSEVMGAAKVLPFGISVP